MAGNMIFLVLFLTAATASAQFESSGSGSGSGSGYWEGSGSESWEGSGSESWYGSGSGYWEGSGSESWTDSGSGFWEGSADATIQEGGNPNQDFDCRGGQVFKECGTACPNVCGQEPALFCILSCVIGCQCPDNMWLDHDGTCVAHEDCSTDIAIHDVEPGTNTNTAGNSYESHDLNCEQYEGYNDECHIRQAWTCHYTEWRLNFYNVWLKMFAEYRNTHSPLAWEMPACTVTEDMVNCANDGMKVCMSSSVLIDCPICYCADHVYQNVSVLRDVWRSDYQEWSRLMQEWEEDASAAQHQNNASSNLDECN